MGRRNVNINALMGRVEARTAARKARQAAQPPPPKQEEKPHVQIQEPPKEERIEIDMDSLPPAIRKAVEEMNSYKE